MNAFPTTTKIYVKTIPRMRQSEHSKIILNTALSISHKHYKELIVKNKALSKGMSVLERARKKNDEFMTERSKYNVHFICI